MVSAESVKAPMQQSMSLQESEQSAPRGSRRSTRGLDREARSILEQTVAREVIPRLAAFPWMQMIEAAQAANPTDPRQIQHLLSLCLDADPQGVASYVAQLHAGGMQPESIYLELMTPVARELGRMWAEDECNFAETTVGVMRLQNAQRALTASFVGTVRTRLDSPVVIMLPVPGEQHTFGLSMVMDFFRRAGWDSSLATASTEAAAVALVKARHIDLVGLSLACDDRINATKRLLRMMRAASVNPNLKIIVGGPCFVEDPALAGQIGADGTARDGHQAVLMSHSLLHAAEQPAR